MASLGGTDEPTEDRPYTIEGGDVIILSPQAVLVGASERTRSETIELLAAKCFQFGHVERVYEVPIPTERTFMHLDTVFTPVVTAENKMAARFRLWCDCFVLCFKRN